MFLYQNINIKNLHFLFIPVDKNIECFNVSKKKPIKDLRVPKEAVFGGIIRDGKALMTYGDMQIQNGDKVIVFCLPEAITAVEHLFN